nr:hypothetical protein GCM10020092_016550 [Actinoplanes digitatis]
MTATATRPRKRSLKNIGRAPQDTRGSWHTYLGLAAFLALSAFPLYWMFVIATSDDEAVSQIPPSVVPGDQLMENLHEVFTMQQVYFAASLINSFIVSAAVTASTLFFCSMAGFAFAKLRFPGRDKLMIVVILTLTIPNQLGIVALYILMGKFGWNGTLVSVIVPFLVSAFGVFYMRQFIMQAVPDELVESARMDGALTMRVYWSIVLLSHPPGAGRARPAHVRRDVERVPVAADPAQRHTVPHLDGGALRPRQRQLRHLPPGARGRVRRHGSAARAAPAGRAADRAGGIMEGAVKS